MTRTLGNAAPDPVLEAIGRYAGADNPSAFLALNLETSRYVQPGLPGVILYRQSGRYLVQFGGPFAPDDSYDELLRRFLDHAEGQGRVPVAVQLQRADAPRYAEHGFTVNQVGASYAVDLDGFSLHGNKFMRLRNKISRALRNGLRIDEVTIADWSDELGEIDQAWLSSKGEHAAPLAFLVGQLGGPAQRHRRLFLGRIGERPVGYISYSPVFGARAGWMHDLSRRVPGGSPGVMEAINCAAIQVFRAEGAGWLHFGFTPFSGLDDRFELPGHSPGLRWFMRFLWAEGAAIYPAQTQYAYKQKWSPDVVIPEYFACPGRASVAGFAHVFRACDAF